MYCQTLGASDLILGLLTLLHQGSNLSNVRFPGWESAQAPKLEIDWLGEFISDPKTGQITLNADYVL